MDNQFNQPGQGMPPQGWPMQPGGVPQQTSSLRPPVGYAPEMNMNPPPGYGAMPLQGDPFGAVPQGQQPMFDPMTGQTVGMPPAGQPMGQAPYAPQGMQPGMAQPYAADGYQHLFDPNQTVMDDQPPAGFPPVEAKPFKERVHLTVFHVAVIVVALGFLGWFLYERLAPEAAQFGVIQAGNLSASHTGDCLIVRNESPYNAEAVTSVHYDAAEGSAIIRGDDICKVYSSGYSTREMETLQEYRAQIRDYQKNMLETETTYDAKLDRVTADVLTRAREVRDLIGGARGSLANQEVLLQTAIDARQKYLKTKYASDQRFTRLYDDELAQTQRIDSWTKQYTATGDGLISFYSDGYEYGLTSSNYMTFEPFQVRNMINGQKPELTSAQKTKTTIYRVVRDNEWYVLFLSNDTDWNPVNGQVYDLQLERFESTQVKAEVMSFTRSGGELLVRLKVISSVKPVLYMRTCEATLGENMSTLMVDERALFVQEGMTGVVMVEGQTESFIPVNVIYTENGYAFIQAITQGFLYENMTVRLF